MLPNEAVILKHEGIKHGAGFTDELILTNLHIVIIKKGAFGGIKSILTIPLSHIKVFDNKAHLLTSRMYPYGDAQLTHLEIYCLNGSERISFQRKKDAINCMNKINQLVINGSISTDPEKKGAEKLAEAFGGTIAAFKGALGKPSSESTEKAINKCSYCGAPISGKKGQVVNCSYCDGRHHL